MATVDLVGTDESGVLHLPDGVVDPLLVHAEGTVGEGCSDLLFGKSPDHGEHVGIREGGDDLRFGVAADAEGCLC